MVESFVLLDSQRVAVVWGETAAGKRMESPGPAAAGADLVSALPGVGKLAANLADQLLELLAGEMN